MNFRGRVVKGKRGACFISFTFGLLTAQAAYTNVLGSPSGTGPWPAVAESLPDLPGHTVYHPAKLPALPLPLFVWGNGACRDNGLQHGAFLRQIASQGYFVVALGRPREERPFNPAPPAGAAGGRTGTTATAQHARRDPERADARGHRLGNPRKRARGRCIPGTHRCIAHRRRGPQLWWIAGAGRFR